MLVTGLVCRDDNGDDEKTSSAADQVALEIETEEEKEDTKSEERSESAAVYMLAPGADEDMGPMILMSGQMTEEKTTEGLFAEMEDDVTSCLQGILNARYIEMITLILITRAEKSLWSHNNSSSLIPSKSRGTSRLFFIVTKEM